MTDNQTTKPLKLLISRERLWEKIQADPDADVEAGLPQVLDEPWTDLHQRLLCAISEVHLGDVHEGTAIIRAVVKELANKHP